MVRDATEPVSHMVDVMGDGLEVPTELVPRCPYCGAEAFPWVRGYGNFLQGKLYKEQYRKVSDWLDAHAKQKILFLELGVGRITPAFIQEPFWALTAQLPQASYIAVNNKTRFLPRAIEDRGMAIRADIADVLADARKALESLGRYERFVHEHSNSRVLLLELGVGEMTPGIITLPFWSMAAKLPDAHLLSVNISGGSAPLQLGSKAEAIQADLGILLSSAQAGDK